MTVERQISIDPRSPYVLSTHELGRRPGEMRRVSRTVPAPEDFGTAVIGFPAGTDLELDLRLESVMEGVLVSGVVSGLAVGECVRCLAELHRDVEVSLQELYVYPDRAKVAAEDGDEDEDLREIEAELIDLEPALRDTVVPTLPFQPVCRDDCPGLCPECGARLADDPGHSHQVADPRWAALQSMFDETKES